MKKRTRRTAPPAKISVRWVEDILIQGLVKVGRDLIHWDNCGYWLGSGFPCLAHLGLGLELQLPIDGRPDLDGDNGQPREELEERLPSMGETEDG